MATSTSSRSAAQAARAGRSASELAGIGAGPARARAWGQRFRLTRPRKLADDRSNFCSQIGNTALVTCTDRSPTAAGRILRYLIHSHIFTNRQELGLREL